MKTIAVRFSLAFGERYHTIDAMKTAICCGFICCDLMTTVNHYPKENEKQFIEDMRVSVGGPAANAACLLARWGVRTRLLGQLGDDHFSEVVLKDLHDAGVNTDGVERYDGPTNCAVILSNTQSGSRTVLSRKYSDSFLEQSMTANNDADAILIDGHQRDRSEKLLRGFSGVSVLDAGSWRDDTAALLGLVTDPVASNGFYQQLVTSNPGVAVTERVRKRLVVTDGEQPVRVFRNNGVQSIPVFAATAVDTLAAGDVFHGAYLFGKLHRCSTAASIVLGAAAAAISVTRRGGVHSIPTLKETNAFLSVQPTPHTKDVLNVLSAL